MSFTFDSNWTPEPDQHGVWMPPPNATELVLPYGDQHGDVSYPIDSSGDVHPAADNHCNDQFAASMMHPGTPKPGSWKDQQVVQPKQPPVY